MATLDVLSQTIAAIHDETSMLLTKATPFLDRVKSLGKVHSFNGSYQLSIPVEVDTPGNITSFSTGYETFDMTLRDSTQRATFTWGRAGIPISISGRDKAENAGEYQVVDLAETRYRSAMASLMRALNKQLVVGQSVGNALADFGTLNGNTSAGGSATGFFEAVAAGSQVNSVGGLSKTTYASVAGWQNQYATAGGDFSANGLDALRQVRTACQLNRASATDKLFHLVLASQAGFNNYEAALYNQQRYVDTTKLDSGVYSLAYGDAVVVADPDITLNNVTYTGANAISFYMLNLDGVTLAIHDEGDFKLTPFIDIPNQDVSTAKIMLMGGLIAKNLGGCGLIVNGETY